MNAAEGSMNLAFKKGEAILDMLKYLFRDKGFSQIEAARVLRDIAVSLCSGTGPGHLITNMINLDTREGCSQDACRFWDRKPFWNHDTRKIEDKCSCWLPSGDVTPMEDVDGCKRSPQCLKCLPLSARREKENKTE